MCGLPSRNWACCSMACNRSLSSVFSVVRPVVSLYTAVKQMLEWISLSNVTQVQTHKSGNGWKRCCTVADIPRCRKFATYLVTEELCTACNRFIDVRSGENPEYLIQSELRRKSGCFCLQGLNFPLQLQYISSFSLFWAGCRLPICKNSAGSIR